MAVLAFLAGLAAFFGLGPLFLLAGQFSAGSLRRRGPAAFARGRLLRLGLPLVAFVYLIDPVTAYVGSLGEGDGPSLSTYLDVT